MVGLLGVLTSTLAMAAMAMLPTDDWGPDPSWKPAAVTGLGAISSCAVSSSGDVYVGNRGKINTILVLDRVTGKTKNAFGLGQFKTVHGMKIQQVGTAEYLWVTDSGNSTVHKYSLPDGKLLMSLGSKGTATHPLQFGSVADVAFDGNGSAYISDGDGGINSRISKLNPAGTVDWVTGNGGTMPASGLFASPHSIAFDALNNRILVADRGNGTVRVFDPLSGNENRSAAWKNVFIYSVGGAMCESPAVWSVRTDSVQHHAYVGTSTFGSGAKCSSSFPEMSEIVQIDLRTMSVLARIGVQASATTPVGFPHEICVDVSSAKVYAANVDAPVTDGMNALHRYEKTSN